MVKCTFSREDSSSLQPTPNRFYVKVDFIETSSCHKVTISNCSFIRNRHNKYVVHMKVTKHTRILFKDTCFRENTIGKHQIEEKVYFRRQNVSPFLFNSAIIVVDYQSDDLPQTYNLTNTAPAPWVGICNCIFEDNVKRD